MKMKDTGASSILGAPFSKRRWVDQISKNFDDEVSVNISNVPVSVFSVPKSITMFKPEAYAPQAIALGPYHHFEPHLYQMERYKVAAVKAFLHPDHVVSFKSLVIEPLKVAEPMIRACYHKYLDLDHETLAWIVAVDGLFLLDFFRHYRETARILPKSLNSTVFYRDVMVLENQVPLVILNQIRKIINVSSAAEDPELLSMLRRFCEVHSPLKLSCDSSVPVGSTGYLHLLDLMYHLIVNNQSAKPAPRTESWLDERADEMQDSSEGDRVIENMEDVVEMGLKLGKVKKVGKPLELIVSIPWEKITNLLGLNFVAKPDKDDDDDHPRVVEIEIPSASSLCKYGGVGFSRVAGGIRDVKFVETKAKATLHLPVVILDLYSEVVLRNLVAYEAAMSGSTLELARYVDLMSGIIDTEADVELLKGKGVIEGGMTNKEIVEVFNGMNKSNAHARGNKTIERLNRYYSSRLAIKAWRFVKKQARDSRKVAAVVLSLAGILLMILYSFCEVYGCPSFFNRET